MIIRSLIIALGLSPLLLTASSRSSSSNGERRRLHSVYAAQQNLDHLEQRATKQQRLAAQLTYIDYLKRSHLHIYTAAANNSGEYYLAAVHDLSVALSLIDKAPLNELGRAKYIANHHGRYPLSLVTFATYPQLLYACATLTQQRMDALSQRKNIISLSELPAHNPRRLELFQKPFEFLSLLKLCRLAPVNKTFTALAKKAEPTVYGWRTRINDLIKSNAAPYQFVTSLMRYRYPISALQAITNRYCCEPEFMRIHNDRINLTDWYKASGSHETEVTARVMANDSANLLSPLRLLYEHEIASYLFFLLTGEESTIPIQLPDSLKKGLAEAVEQQKPALYARLIRQDCHHEASQISKTGQNAQLTDTDALWHSLEQHQATISAETNPFVKEALIIHMINKIHFACAHNLITSFDAWHKVRGVLQGFNKCTSNRIVMSLVHALQRTEEVGNILLAKTPRDMTADEICTYIERSIPMLEGVTVKIRHFRQRLLVAKIDELESRFADPLSLSAYVLIARATMYLSPGLRNLKAKPAIQKLLSI